MSQAASLANIPMFKPRDGVTIVKPPGEGRGNWAGAPQVWHDGSGDFWLVYRLRKPHPLRGYQLNIARSSDGVHFKIIWQATKEQFGTESMERCVLVRLGTKHWRLFVSHVDATDRRWRIDMLDAQLPSDFDPARRRKILTARDVGVEGVKDPVLYRWGGRWFMFISFSPTPAETSPARQKQMHATGDVFATGLSRSATALAVSDDAENWHWEGEVFSNRPGAWDAYAGRISSVLRQPPNHIAFYDGSATVQENYEERTGIAINADPCHWERLSLSEPALTSPYGSGSLRYIDVIAVGHEWWFYYEMCRADGSHELRLSRVKKQRTLEGGNRVQEIACFPGEARAGTAG